MCSWPNGPGAPQLVEEHPVANVDVEDQDERFQNDHCLRLLATARDMGPTSKQVVGLKGGSVATPCQVHWSAVSVST